MNRRDYEKKDYYAILEIKKSATEKEIKDAFRNQAKNFHPDAYSLVNQGKHLTERFQGINEAYQVLTKDRVMYDSVYKYDGPQDYELYKEDKSNKPLKELLYKGYDIIGWVAKGGTDNKGKKLSPCQRCMEIQKTLDSASFQEAGIPDGFIPLAGFLGMKRIPVKHPDGTPKKDDSGNPVYTYVQAVPHKTSHPATLFNWAHIGCNCHLKVSKRKDPNDIKTVSKDGLLDK
jgi:curved DNA-binding protein CbpA